jgi:hypothetical protein
MAQTLTIRHFGGAAMAGLLCVCGAPSPGQHAEDSTQDPHAIVVRSIAAQQQAEKARTSYLYETHETSRDLDSSGKVKAQHTTVSEVSYIGGRERHRLLQKDGRPLSPAEAQREQEKIDQAASGAPAADRGPGRRREMMQHIPDAFDFKLLADTVVEGCPAYQIAARPRAGYNGKYANMLRNVAGTLFIDKQSFEWTHVDAVALSTLSYGLFLARVAKGSHMALEQTRVNDEVWLPKRLAVNVTARIGLVKKLDLDREIVFSGYRKFQVDSRMTVSKDVTAK